MKKFEYTVLDVPSKSIWGFKIDYAALTARLNELGRQGWEVTTINDTNKHHGASLAIIIILKRELSN